MTKDIIENLPNLKIISLQSIGYNNVDIKSATENNLRVTNVPGFCTEWGAENKILNWWKVNIQAVIKKVL